MEKMIMLVVVVLMVVGAPAVYAETEYQSGFKHGVADGKLDKANSSEKDYVEQPGNGLDNHTPEFANGYVKGWCSIIGPNHGKEIDTGKPESSTVFDCERTN